jgi:hypothetical protein
VNDSLIVLPAGKSDGSCMACSCDEYGYYHTMGRVWIIRARGWETRLCHGHLKIVASETGIKRLGGKGE